MLQKFWDWLDDRSGVRHFLHEALYERLPQKVGWAHVLGSGALFLFGLQALTGILLAMNYVPSTREAHASVMHITNEVPFGKIVRGLHHWGASAMVVVVVLHMLRVFVFGAYKKPRELTWMVGVILFVLVLGFSFTGYLLPYDQKAYWATKVGVNFAGYVPFIGEHIKRIMYGGSDIGAPTLTRFYAIHVLVLPALIVPLIAIHLALMRRKGEMPPGTEAEDEGRVEKPITFYPHQAFKDICFAALLLTVLLSLTIKFGVPTERLADPADQNYIPRPEWYFLPLFQLEKLRIGDFAFFGGSRVWLGTVLVPALFVLGLLLLPFFDRNPSRLPRKRRAQLLMLGVLLYCVVILGVTAARQTPSNAPSEFSGAARLGQKLFKQKCMKCHQVNGEGGTHGPEFVKLKGKEESPWTKDELILYIINPAEKYPTGKMPSAKAMELRSLDQLDAIAEFLMHFKAVWHKPPPPTVASGAR